MSIFWFTIGAFIGFDTALGYAWITTRRARKEVDALAKRVRAYTAKPW